jgi:PAS domain S-box-containing protein
MSSLTLVKQPQAGIALLCDLKGKVTKLLRDDTGLFSSIDEGDSVLTMVDQASSEKAERFLAHVNASGAAFDWELNVSQSGFIRKLHFAGGKMGEGVLVVGSTSRTDLSQLYEDVANNQGLGTHLVAAAAARAQTDDSLYCELSRLNNELVNAQRELAKTSAQTEHLHAELSRAHELLESVYAMAPVGLCLIDREFRWVLINPTMATMNGRSIKDHIGQRVADLLPDLWPELETIYMRVLQGEAVQTDIHGVRHSHPEENRHWQCSYYPVRSGKAGEVNGISCIVEDVTERRRAEDNLRRREERASIAMRAARSGIWEWEFKTDRVIWSPEQEALYGLAPGTFGGDIEQWRRMVEPEDLANVVKTLEHAAKTHSDYTVEFRITRADRAQRWIESLGQIFYDENGEAQRIVGVNTDITARKQVELSLIKSDFRFKRFVDSNVIGIVIATMDGITEANDVFLQMIGCTREDFAKDRVDRAKATPAEYLPRDLDGIEQLKTYGSCVPFEKEYIRKDGSRIPILIGATALSQDPLEWICFVLDMSALKQTEAELRDARDRLEHKVAERTQELREMLARLEMEVRIRAEAEQRMRDLSARLLRLQDEERRRIARDLHDSTGQTLAALKMALASLHGVVGKIAAAESLFEDLDGLADQALKEIRTTSHLLHPPLLDEAGFASAARWYVEGFSKRSNIQVELDIEITEKLASPVEMVLFRVLQESLTNVLRHSGATKAEVRLRGGEEVVLTIKDYGRGIAADRVEQFMQTGEGAGVGLAGMRERARELGGCLELQSDLSGTTVTVRLTRVVQSDEQAGTQTAESDQSAPAA